MGTVQNITFLGGTHTKTYTGGQSYALTGVVANILFGAGANTMIYVVGTPGPYTGPTIAEIPDVHKALRRRKMPWLYN